MILKINGSNRSVDLVHLALEGTPPQKTFSQKKPAPKSKNLYGISKLGDGRFCLLSSQGFTIW